MGRVLIRMGAADSSAAHRLDWWRPLSSSFLHGSLLHVGGNMLVLWLIGGFLERSLVPWRLLALWMGSVVGGSAAAIAFGPPDSVMVGASGGGWGLMVAAGVISLRGAGVVPEPLAVGMRQSIRNVLVLNLMISFVPGISLMAHLGGGLAGGAMTLLGVATVGMRSPERAATAIGRDAWAAPVVAAGVLSAALLLGSLAAAFVDGRPWASILEGAWVEHETGVSGVRIELPAALGEGRREDDGVVYGDPRGTEYVVTVQAAPFDAKALTSSKVFLEYHRTKKALLKEELPDGFRREGAPIEHEKGTRFELQEQFAVGDGRAVRRTVAVPAGVVTVTVLEAPGVPPLAVRWTFSEP